MRAEITLQDTYSVQATALFEHTVYYAVYYATLTHSPPLEAPMCWLPPPARTDTRPVIARAWTRRRLVLQGTTSPLRAHIVANDRYKPFQKISHHRFR